MAARSLNMHSASVRPPKFSSQSKPIGYYGFKTAKSISCIAHRIILCSTLQESSTATVSDEKKKADRAVLAAENQVTAPIKKEAAAKPKKATVKPLPEMMEEDVIPSLRATLQDQEDISQIEISFQENRAPSSRKRSPTISGHSSQMESSQVPKGSLYPPMAQGSALLSPF